MTRLRIAGVLLSALAATVIPPAVHATAKPVNPDPPKACATTSGYSADGSYHSELEICMTTRRGRHPGGYEYDAPTVSVEAKCSHKTLLLWSEQGSCDWKANVVMKKDGVTAWDENWHNRTEATHSGARTYYEYYRCRGNGTYTVTIQNINMRSSNNGIVDDWHAVSLNPTTATGKGC